MKAYSIDPKEKKIQVQEFDGQVNSIYTFLDSILVDNSPILNEHNIYTDGQALSTTHTPFFIGEHLFMGNTLITGLTGLEDTDATIELEELEQLINYDVNKFYKKTLNILAEKDINLYKNFEVEAHGERLPLTYEWVIYTFNMADVKTQNYFLIELEKAYEESKDIEEYFQKMAQLAVNAVNR